MNSECLLKELELTRKQLQEVLKELEVQKKMNLRLEAALHGAIKDKEKGK